jgi:Co/Zn/Cd efflux system component
MMAHEKADSLSTPGAPVNEEVQRREWEDSMEDQRLEEALFVNEVGTARGGGGKGAKGAGGHRGEKSGAQENDDAAIPFEFAARTPLEFVTGIGLHVLASTLSALRKGQAHVASRQVGGPKRLFALACPIAVVWLYLFIFYSWLSRRSDAGRAWGEAAGGVAAASADPVAAIKATWVQLLQFAGMGLLVPFYAGNFADKNLPGSDSARIGLISSVASFVFTWAVRMSPMELSSGVVAVTVLFLMLSLGEEVGDDSVPLGVYSVPGLVGNQWGWPWMQTLVRSLLRNLAVASRSDARRIALLLLVNLVAMVVLVAVGLYQWNNRLLALALRLLYSCTILGIGLIGTIIKYSRASLDFSYGYTRFETLCGFTNALLLVFTSICGGLDDFARLLEPPDKAVPATSRDPSAPGVSVWMALAALVLQVGCAAVASVIHKTDAAAARAKAPKGVLPEDWRSVRARRFDRGGGAATSPSMSAKAMKLLNAPSILLNLSDVSRNHNVQAVYVHLVGEVLAAAVLLLTSLAVGDGAGGAPLAIILKLLSLLSGGVVLVCVVPIAYDACVVLMQGTPVELVGALPHLHMRIAGIHPVSGCSALHIWRLNSQSLVATIKLTAGPETAGGNLVADVTSLLRQYGVTNTCVEVEREKTETPKRPGREREGPLGESIRPRSPAVTAAGDSTYREPVAAGGGGGGGGGAGGGRASRRLDMDQVGSGIRMDEEPRANTGRAERVMRQIEEEERRGLLGLGLGGAGGRESGINGGDVGDAHFVTHFGANGDSHRRDAALQEGTLPAEMRREISDAEPSYTSMSDDALFTPQSGYGLERKLLGRKISREYLVPEEGDRDAVGGVHPGGEGNGEFSDIKL